MHENKPAMYHIIYKTALCSNCLSFYVLYAEKHAYRPDKII